MKIPALLLPLLPILTLLASSLTTAADVIQTQPATSGEVEVDVIKASAKDGILTVLLSYRNKGSEEVRIQFKLADVYFIDDKEKKKYLVLKDSKGVWVAAPIYGSDSIDTQAIKAGGKNIVWFKFPAPPASSTKINLIVPNVVPFEDLPISQ
jgi:hypothetical protein